MIEIKHLTVRYGGVTPLDDVSITFPMGRCALIGPNGAGKTTLLNVLSGFARPVSGSISAFGTDLLGMQSFRRARWGVRRSFQTEQTIANLSLYDNVAIVQEHAREHRAERSAEVMDALAFVGLNAKAAVLAGTLNTREKRVLELARAVVGTPKLVLLDEPAAGLTDDETAELVHIIRRIPEERGALVVLVDHDMTLVSAVCEMTAVLDFGKVIATGPTAEVLRDGRVQRAYLGTDESVLDGEDVA